MQQRYYDPIAGRFLSVDPVSADPNSGANFNRYWYANNNPYKYTDPDGRCPVCVFVIGRFLVGASIDIAKQVFVDDKSLGDVDLGDAAMAGAVTAAIPGLANLGKAGIEGTKAVVPAARAIAKVASKSANTANRAAKNATAIARNIGKIEGAAGEVGKAAAVAGVNQVVKVAAQSGMPETKASDVRGAVNPPAPPPPPEEKLLN